ncbi:hypothetical protein MMC17_002500 [Xylographa soralifera]|nr:hypothetical protein [Xylographa soralifera]
MADKGIEKAEEEAKASAISYARLWGESPVPPALLATLIAAQHARPPQFLPLLFPPALLFSTYLNINEYKIDAAGTSAAWSALYLLLARRRKQPLMQKWGTRGIVRGATMGLCVANLLGGGFVYAIGKRTNDASGKDGTGII